MSNIIKLKTGAGVPTQNDLVENEVGISTSTYRLYQGRNGSDPVQIGTEIFSGEGTPSDDLGKNGDLYIQLTTDSPGDSAEIQNIITQLQAINGESLSTAEENLESLTNTKASIKTAIETKGVTVGDIPFDQYGEKINSIEIPKKGELEWVPIQGVDTYAPFPEPWFFQKVDIPLLEGAKGILLRSEFSNNTNFIRRRLFLYPLDKEYGQPLTNGDVLSNLEFPFSSSGSHIESEPITISNNTITFYIEPLAQAYYAFVR